MFEDSVDDVDASEPAGRHVTSMLSNLRLLLTQRVGVVSRFRGFEVSSANENHRFKKSGRCVGQRLTWGCLAGRGGGSAILGLPCLRRCYTPGIMLSVNWVLLSVAGFVYCLLPAKL